jgi:hypothetical protein
MSSSKKRQSTRKTETPDWAADVKPSEDVMAMFYAPTGQPKQGPLIPLPQPTAASRVESSDAGENEVSQPVSADQQSDLDDKAATVYASEQSAQRKDVESQAVLREEASVAATPPEEHPQDPSATVISEEVVSPAESQQAQKAATVENVRAEHAEVSSSGPVLGDDESVVRTAAKAAEFEEFFGQWEPFLTDGQAKVLRALFEMTYAIGRSECLTSTSRLAAAAGMSERQTSSIARDLEKLGFISRPETFNTRTKKGTVFQLFLSRQNSTTSVKRHYHFED